jgi:hypothetical protein
VQVSGSRNGHHHVVIDAHGHVQVRKVPNPTSSLYPSHPHTQGAVKAMDTLKVGINEYCSASEARGDHSLLYFAYTCVRDLFIGGVIYLAKKIIR